MPERRLGHFRRINVPERRGQDPVDTVGLVHFTTLPRARSKNSEGGRHHKTCPELMLPNSF